MAKRTSRKGQRGTDKPTRLSEAERAETQAAAAVEPSPMPTACPECSQPVDAIREQEQTKVAGATVTAAGRQIGFVCQNEACPSYGTQRLFVEPEEERKARAKAQKQQRAAAAVEEEPEDLSDLPKVLQQALVAFGLKRDHVLDHAMRSEPGRTKRDAKETVTIVTRGGQTLKYPGDEAKAARLTDAEKDGGQRTPAPRFFEGGLAPRTGATRG